MNLDKLTIGEAKQLASMFGGSNECKQRITQDGDKVFIRTLTFHYTGRVIGETNDVIILEEAAWIADSGRFMNAISEGKLNEVEPIPGHVKIVKQNISDVIEWKHELPSEQK